MPRSIFILFFFLLIPSAFSEDKVIYGEDNRLDVFEVKSLFWRGMSDSTAALVSKKKLGIENGKIKVIDDSIRENMNLCPGEKFENQKNPADCSGFLFGERLIITAGHCTNKNFCENYFWVFGLYQAKSSNEIFLPLENIYSCKKIIAKTQNSSTMEDWAIIELDRPVKHFTGVEIRTDGEISVGEELVVIGHPSGLPTKIAAGAFVRENSDENFFVANLDTFGGNSGSAVFNGKTGLVEGILVRGERDYVSDKVDGKECIRPKRCAMNECRGEDVQKIPPILLYLNTGNF